jgi:hypothetical protein
MTPGRALYGLLSALAEQGITARGMTMTRLGGTLFPDRGHPIGYRAGFFWWRAGLSATGRSLYAIHPATDTRGAARRLSEIDANWDTLRQALEDAITTRAQSAVQPCQACAMCPALLCPLHAAELDWVSLYRTLARDLGIALKQAREPEPARTAGRGRLVPGRP